MGPGAHIEILMKGGRKIGQVVSQTMGFEGSADLIEQR